MSSVAADKSSSGNGAAEATGGRRVTMHVGSLDEIVGAHPDALRKIYLNGRATDPAELGDAPRGRLLAFEPRSDVFLVTRPIVRALARGILPWQGKVFDHGGNGGQNVVFGRRAFRFRTELGTSAVDGKATLLLRYDERSFHNPWPVSAVIDELRTVAAGIAIGPVFMSVSGELRRLLWFGLSAS